MEYQLIGLTKRILTYNLKRSASLYPSHVAFKQLNETINYEELVLLSNQLAHLLIDLGTKKGDRVGIFMNRSIASSWATYGIMTAGAAYVPIDSNLPAHRVTELVQDCGISIIISQPRFEKRISQIFGENKLLDFVIGLENNISNETRSYSWSDVRSAGHHEVSVELLESDLAYIMYTSGTTGKQKGIMHTHFSGCSYAKLSAELYQVDQHDILGNHSHLHFDISTMGYLTMPYAGGTTVIVPEAHTIFPTSLAKLIESERMTIWYSVPLALIQLLESGTLGDLDLSHLRWILFGGEPFAIKHLQALFEYMPKATFSNVYGPAEVNQCTYYNFDKTSILESPIPIGQAWPETKLKINYQSQEDQKESIGELLVYSTTQMSAYWNQQELTAQKLINLDNNETDEKYYKTGDIVRVHPNGDLVFVGRSDRQVKVRGYRVEMNEIENVLLRHDNITGAAVYAIKNEDVWSIYACVVLLATELDELKIKKYLSQYLPQHALPFQIRFIETIPRTSAGKIDYKSLTK